MTTWTNRASDPLMKRILRWLVPDQRVANRHSMPPLIAHLGQDRSSKEYKVGDISVAGFYLITEERWTLGTGFPITLERVDAEGQDQTLTLLSTVVRIGADGVGFTFAQPVKEVSASGDSYTSTTLDLAQFLKGLPPSHADAATLERAT